MVTRWSSQLRALLALALFATSDGGAQLLDAVVYHSHPVKAETTRLNAGDHCHAENCELGAPIASPPPLTPPDVGDRFEPVYRRAVAVVPADAPRTTRPAVPLGSRAPPLQS
jgi:hypothetical protein